MGDGGRAAKRYLWTDAFAVQSCFGLARALDEPEWRDIGLELIEAVHETLGRHRRDDAGSGWISGIPEEEGRAHPTLGGLRIGKELPERQPDEPPNEQMEWERDGQYFHYLTRWMDALLLAARETADPQYAFWAAELAQAGAKFIATGPGGLRMYWKMSIDLSRPLVESMGAHDPLDGLICVERILQVLPGKRSDLRSLRIAFAELCSGRDWSTTDPLGIGGLLMDTAQAVRLAISTPTLPAEIRPEKLFADSLSGLETYRRRGAARGPASQRLAFRECGLSLGLRALEGCGHQAQSVIGEYAAIHPYMPLAGEIESFWMDASHQRSPTWTEHLDINAVTLAASLIARVTG